MAKVIKNVSFSWEWTGDERLLQGFNLAICKATEDPSTEVTTSTFLRMSGISETPVTLNPSYTFSNVTLDDGLYYVPYVQAVYPGDDSEWLGATGILIDDDGTSTVATQSTIPQTFFTAAPDTPPSGKYGDSWIKSDSSEWRHNGTTWVEGKYGQDGVNGTRTAILEMYQGAASIPTTFPQGSSTYTWATGQFTAPGTPNSWQLTPPTLTAGQTLWICRTVYADALTGATTSITWPVTNYARAASSNGADGANGARTAVLEVYKWQPTGTSSFSYPSGTSAYTWTTGVFDLPATPNGWSLLPGAATQGYTLFACQVVHSDTLTTATSSISWAAVSTAYAVGVAGVDGASAYNGLLTNENHTVAALSTGLGYSLTSAGGTFKVYLGATDVTASSTFAITGGSDSGTFWTKAQNNLTFSINETTGVYSLSGASWSTSNESFTVTATHGGNVITKVYTISKSLAGAGGSTGAAANVVTVTGEQAFKFLADSATPVSSNITLTAVLSGSLTTYDWEYWNVSAWVNLSGTQNASTYNLAYNNAAWGSATSLRVRCLSGSSYDEITIAKLYDGAAGVDGDSGVSVVVVNMYKVGGGALPTGTTFTFSTGVVSGTLNGWIQAMPASGINPTYMTTCRFTATAPTDTHTNSAWSAQVIVAQTGAANGRNLILGTGFESTTGYLKYNVTSISVANNKLTIVGDGVNDGVETTTFNLIANVVYTCSFKTDVVATWNYLFLRQNQTAPSIKGLGLSLTPDSTGLITFQFSHTVDVANANLLLGWATGTDLTRKIWDLKIEEGSQATGWSPAPEDLQNQLDGLKIYKSTVPATPTFGTLSGVLDTAVTNANGSVDVKFTWGYTDYTGINGDQYDIDGFYIYLYNSGTSAPGSAVDLAAAISAGTATRYSIPNVAGATKGFVVKGLSANAYYTFGVKAYRVVDSSVAVLGVLLSTLAQPTLITTGEYVFGAWRSSATSDISGVIKGIISGINLPPLGGSESGLVIRQAGLGYAESGVWKSYIGNDGKFLFEGNATNKIGWDGSTLAIQGAIVTEGSITGTTLQTEVTASRGIKISTANGFEAFNGSGVKTVSIGIDGSASFVGNITGSTITGSNFKTGIGGSYIELAVGNELIFHNTGGDCTFYSNGNGVLVDGYMESQLLIGTNQSGMWSFNYLATTGNFVTAIAGGKGTHASNGLQLSTSSNSIPLKLVPNTILPIDRSNGSVCNYGGWLCFANGVHWFQSNGVQLT